MYNRYIPQSDGSYRRDRIPNQPQSPQKSSQNSPQQQEPPAQTHPASPPQHGSVGGFLRQLLPKNFDTADLLIVLLLLLMAGDCEEEQNTALLTLALYFFM